LDNNYFHVQTQITVSGAKPPLASVTLLSYALYNKNPFNLSDALI
jgi:hypothetical protein